jgi:hemerythrin
VETVEFRIPETGVKEIDRQHAELLVSLQSLSSWVGTTNEKEIAATFNAIMYLNDYVDKHFRFEEAFLRKNEYPDIDAHVRGHEALRKKVSGLTERLLSGEDDLTKEIVSTMSAWIITHIGEEDLEYAKCLRRGEET